MFTPSITSTLAGGSRRLTIALAATMAVALVGMLGLAMSPASAQAGNWDYLMPAPGACGPWESNPYAARADQATAAACVANAVRQNYGRARLGPEGWGLGVLFIAGSFKGGDVMKCQGGDPHTACNRPMDYWIQRYGYRTYCPSGWFAENIYIGAGSLSTAREAVKWWVNSDKGHRDALLDPQWTKHGMGLSSPGTYRYPDGRSFPSSVGWVHYMCR